MNFLAPLDARTLLYVARAEDWSGPWLWALDVESKVTRRVTSGLEHYTSVSASRDGRRVVATVANPTASLWRVPLLDRLVEDRDVQPYARADGTGAGAAVRRDVAVLSVALVPRDGRRPVAGAGRAGVRSAEGRRRVVVRAPRGVAGRQPRGGRRQTAGETAPRHHVGGRHERTNAGASIDIQGAAGQGTADWSPDGSWIVAGGSDAQGPGLFKIPVDGGEPVRLVAGQARQSGLVAGRDLIVYAGPVRRAGGRTRSVGETGWHPGRIAGRRVRLGGPIASCAAVRVWCTCQRIESKDFWLLDLATNKTRQLTHLSDRGYLNTFDITPDGKHIVFDRSRENSDIVLIDLPKQ